MNKKEPSQAELDEMWDFGQYVSWKLEHGEKAVEEESAKHQSAPESYTSLKDDASEEAEALINLGYAVAAGSVTLEALNTMDWFVEPKTELERHYKNLFLHTLREKD